MTEFANLKLPDELHLKYLGGGQWELLRPYRAVWDGGRVEAPKGFRTDLASIPRLARSIIPQIGDQNGPAVIHDWCYRHRWKARALSDALFLATMKVKAVNWLRRNIIYAAVRAGGWVTWNKEGNET